MVRLPLNDLNLLVILAELIRTRNITLTARHLRMSQPSVSRALGRLREHLGDPLLMRTTGGMHLTQRAQDLARPLQEWLESTSGLLTPQQFAPATLERAFRLASGDYGVSAVIAPALPAIRAQAPGVELDIRPSSADLPARLGSGDIDMIVSALPVESTSVHERMLFAEEFRCLVDHAHPLAQRDPQRAPSLEEFLAWPHIALTISDGGAGHDPVEASLGHRAEERRVIARLSYLQAAPDLLTGSEAIITLPRRAAERFSRVHGFACLPAPPIRPITYRLLWHDRAQRDPAVQWLAAMLEAGCREPETGRLRAA
ncbi:LysR family transcriptional regulator [Altererythrobacter xixiisoli]|uniref:LysR family transcriptional regulator n=1 Tax=Croceibacterium xixiisoli TaxID=1476466 RepID=A0A6I4TZ16_9SPHN|nr:LysR family transcriptional regulator [Croceibacterium xixiisoli]MXP00551.1 LysR family transcriptional regulator [Croceibacterium xixiisoli]